jgi:hypothetical protein
MIHTLIVAFSLGIITLGALFVGFAGYLVIDEWRYRRQAAYRRRVIREEVGR